MGRSSLPDWYKGARPLERGALKFAWLIERGASTWKGRAHLKNGTYSLKTYWFSIQYPDGVVQVVSITGFRLENGASQIFFFRQPRRQASTKCPLPALKQLNFWMQILSQLSRFMNWSIDHYDLDFLLTFCDITRWPHRGHEAALDDAMLKGGGVSCWGR